MACGPGSVRRPSKGRLLAAALAVVALSFAAPATVVAQDAEALFREGSAAHDRGELELARTRYAEAYRLAPSVAIAANLGVVEALLGRHRDAATHLTFALARYPEAGDPEKRKRMAAELSRVLGYVGELRIRAPAGARVAVDGEVVGEAPLAAPVYVDPGLRRVEATLAGAPPIVREVKAAAGEVSELDLAEPAASPPIGAPADPPAEAEPTSGFRTDPVLVVGGAGVALIGLGLGLTFTVLSSGAGSDADAATADLLRAGGNPCLGAAPPATCAEVQSDLEARDGLRTAAVVSFVASGAAALGTVAYVLVSSMTEDAPSAGRLRVVPAFGTDLRGVAATGTF